MKERIRFLVALVISVVFLGGISSRSLASECDLSSDRPDWVFCHDFESADADGSDSYWSTYWNDTYGAPERVFLIEENPAGVEGVHSMRMQVVNNTDEALSSGVTLKSRSRASVGERPTRTMRAMW